MWWLENRVLKDFDKVHVTFFVPIDRVAETVERQCDGHFGSIAENESIAGFFRSVHNTPRYELAYHGLTHGVSAAPGRPFLQEWESFASLDEAVAVTNRGREVFRQVTGEYPRGGKYCGYRRKEFSDASIDRCGFMWWCRYDTRGDTSVGAEQPDRFDVSYFGAQPVVDLPTTVHGDAVSLPSERRWGVGWWRSVLGNGRRRRRLRRHLDFLLAHGLPILIQEHSAASRSNGRKQTPNIVDDTRSLRWILRQLERGNVWHATCSEIAAYARVRDAVQVRTVEGGTAIELAGVPVVSNTEVTLRFDCAATGALRLEGPTGRSSPVKVRDGHAVVNLVPANGPHRVYRV